MSRNNIKAILKQKAVVRYCMPHVLRPVMGEFDTQEVSSSDFSVYSHVECAVDTRWHKDMNVGFEW